MTLLAAAALIWIGCHIGIAGTSLRGTLVRRLGDPGFRTGFSVVSVIVIGLLVTAYRRAPFLGLWSPPSWLGWLLVLAMLPAFLLFAASLFTPNPTAMGQDKALLQAPRGILRITRHPMLWSFALWAIVHIIGNGDLASVVFFGAFLVTALAGMPSIDAKVAARDPGHWQHFAASTSIVPFGAILTGRNTLSVAEVPVLALVTGVALWLALLWTHAWVFGVSPLPAA